MAHESLSLDPARSRSDAPAPGAPARDASSHVREKSTDDASRAVRRVVEYLKACGLSDAARASTLAGECAAETHESNADLHARAAVRRAMDRVAAWQAATFGELGSEPDALWLRAFVGAHPEAFLADPGQAGRLAAEFGDASSGRAPRTAHFSEQRLGRPRLPDWLRGLWPPLLLTVGVTVLLGTASAGQGWGPLEALWNGLLLLLLTHAAIGFWTAWSGFHHLETEDEPPAELPAAEPLRVAVAIPIYNEDAGAVFARVLTMQRSLLACAESRPRAGVAFEVFVLSDSQDPLIAAEEERSFRRVTASAAEADTLPIYYRRRRKNEHQKAGNLAEFFERFGQRYEYVVVLDADSLMRGESIAELVRRIHSAPRVALLQAPIVPVGGETLLSRALQWGTSVAGPLFTRGLSRWSGAHGNYYGHNAVIRTRAFLECCALPTLSGTPPLGGPLLSHDFVEAALLCRGGWEVRAAPDLEGSYEGLPPTLADYLVRDRRWCQGNLQHLRIAFSPGLAAMSRIHLLLGAAAYLAGPAGLVFSLVGLWALGAPSFPAGVTPLAVVALVVALLLGPRVLGVVAILRDRQRRQEHGGAVRLCASLGLEAIFAAALAPLLMTHHARIVLRILLGRAVGWAPQRRDPRALARAAARGEIGTTLLGLCCLGTVGWVAFARATPELLLWSAPLWLPLVLAMPIAALAGSAWLGRRLERWGLLLVPSETAPDPILLAAEELRSLTEGDLAGRFRDLILDPVLVRAHLARLSASPASPPTVTQPIRSLGGTEGELCQRALRMGPAGLCESERQALLGSADCVLFLHREAWCHWPIENWHMSRQSPQLPESGPKSALAARHVQFERAQA